MIDIIKKYWFKGLLLLLVVGAWVFLIIPDDTVNRYELVKLEQSLTKQQLQQNQVVVDSLETLLSNTEIKIVSLQKEFEQTKTNLKHLQSNLNNQVQQYQQLKNEISSINYSDSSITAILQRIRAKD